MSRTKRALIRKRGVYLLPNLFTMAALFSGFYAMIAAGSEQFDRAAIALYVAMILDALDGRVARMLNTQTDFGAQFDSLADMVTFGVAPALVAYAWGLHAWGQLGWLITFIYTAFGGMRLARFNTQVGVSDKRYFQGLPIPSAACLCVGYVWLAHIYQWEGVISTLVLCCLLLSTAVLMVSNIRYQSFKDANLKDRMPFLSIVVISLAFVAIALSPAHVIFCLLLLYVVSGPVLTLKKLDVRKRMRRRGKRHED